MNLRIQQKTLEEIDFEEALMLIRESIRREKLHTAYNTYLIENAPTQVERDLLMSIRDDGIDHRGFFIDLYRDLTGITVTSPPPEEVGFDIPKSYIDGVLEAYLEEIESIEAYTNILVAIEDETYRDELLDTILEELRHAGIFTYIFMLNQNGIE